MTQKLVLVKKRNTVPPLEWQDGQRWSSGQTGLFSANRFTYAGSFRAPVINSGARFAFTHGVLAYDETDGTLLAGCHAQFPRKVARISIPTPTAHNGTDASGLPRATMLSAGADNGFVEITDGADTTIGDPPTVVQAGSVRVFNGKIYWTQEPGYDGENLSQTPVLGFSDNTSDLLTLNGQAPSTVSGIHYKNLCRNFAVIPETWANTNVGGRRFLMSCFGISVIAGGSLGPVAVAVDVPTTASETLTHQRLIRFPHEDSTFFQWPTIDDRWDYNQWNRGMEWIEDGSEHWLIFHGYYYFPPYNYKGESPCGANETGFWGYPHRAYLMVFNMTDVLAAANPWDVTPREIIDCREFMIAQGPCEFRGSARGSIAWDSVGKRLFVTEPKGDEVTNQFESNPVWHVLELDAA